jgi:CpXC protein
MAKHGYKFRLSTSFAQLIEKIRIFDDGLDDRVVEIMKAQIEPNVAGYPGPSSRLYYMRRTMNNNDPQVSFYLPAFALGKALMFTPSPEISYSRYERDYGRFFSLIHETSHWMSVDRDFSKEVERRKQIVGPSPEGNKNKLQKGILGSLFG